MKNNFTLSSIIKLLAAKKISSEEITKQLLREIDNKNKKINAFVTINDKALETAKNLDRIDRIGKLHGVPLIFKDNFLTKNIKTTASSKLLDNYIPQYNSTVVQRLLDEGAFILGKTNMDAWAHGSSTETSDYGSTRNPWNLNHLPGGSSGGSAAAVVANMAIAAIGSETAGSIRQPAAWSGCVGLKPTYGRVSRYGVIAMGSSLDSPGPMTKNVEDASILLEIIAGKDPYDSTTSLKPVEKYSNNLKQGVKNMKIGIVQEYLLQDMDSEVKNHIKNAAQTFEKMGAKVNYVNAMDPHYAIGVYTIIQRSEVSSNLSRFDGIRYGHDRSFFGEEAKRRIMLGTFALSEGYADKYYKNALKVRTLYMRNFEDIFEKYDLLIGPTSPGPAKKIGSSIDQDMFGEMEDILIEPSTIAGLPGISLPCGFVDGLPIGLDIIGPQFSEGKIIRAADAYESETNWHNMNPTI
jgi:aspartyl-tRNA(Asn)/glutamyl-tRNA(Gln) amidotransferase subunit A